MAIARPLTRLAGGLALSLLIAACGAGAAVQPTSSPGATSPAGGEPAASSVIGDATPSSAAGAGGLCDLLPQAAAEVALGEPVNGGEAATVSITGSSMCRYLATGSEHSIQIEYSAGRDRADWDESMVLTGMAEGSEVDGLGEAAWQSSDALFGPGTRVAVFDRGLAVWVVISTDAPAAAVLPAAQDVARTLVAELAG